MAIVIFIIAQVLLINIMSADPTVIVIGAGAAGIAAATRLYENGVKDVIVLEAQNTIGGRIKTLELGNDGFIDLGAQWVHGEKNNVAFELASARNLLIHATNFESSLFVNSLPKVIGEEITKLMWYIIEKIHNTLPTAQNATIYKSGGEFIISQLQEEFTKYPIFTEELKLQFQEWLHHLMNSIDASDSWFNTSISEYNEYWECEGDNVISFKEGGYTSILNILLQEEFAKYPIFTEELKLQFQEWLHQSINSVDASDSWFDTSISSYNEYWACEGDSVISFKEGGYTSILNILLEKSDNVSNGQFRKNNIKINNKVILIEWTDNDQVGITCENGNKFVADHVIVTVSLAVLKHNHLQLFKFGLPEQNLKAINGLSIGTVNKMFLVFETRWWPNDTNGFNLLWTKEDKDEYKNQNKTWLTDVFGFHSVYGSPTALLGWITGDSARVMETKSEEEVKIGLMGLLKKFVGHIYKIPEPKSFIRSSWYTNPQIRGSYSFRSITTDQLNTSASNLALPIKNKNKTPAILFAGEATHSHYYSTVHGAIESGWREADALLKIFKTS